MSWKRDFAFFLLTLLAVVSYFVLAAGFGFYQRIPLPHFLLAAIGVLALAFGLRSPGGRIRRGVLFALALLLTVGFTWYTLDYSNYPERDLRVHTGDTLAQLVGLELENHAGEATPVLAENAQATLVIFYRGFW
jgi:disulfide bond formation protein DsbB